MQREVGQALYAAQCGEEYPSVKALKGFGGRAVLETVAAHGGDTYRAIYTAVSYTHLDVYKRQAYPTIVLFP